MSTRPEKSILIETPFECSFCLSMILHRPRAHRKTKLDLHIEPMCGSICTGPIPTPITRRPTNPSSQCRLPFSTLTHYYRWLKHNRSDLSHFRCIDITLDCFASFSLLMIAAFGVVGTKHTRPHPLRSAQLTTANSARKRKYMNSKEGEHVTKR